MTTHYPLQLEPGDAICHRHWLRLARVEGSGITFSLALVRAAFAQQDDVMGDWRDDMAFWISYRRPLCESLPPAEVERAFRLACKKPPEAKSKTKRAQVPTTSIDRSAELFDDD